MRGKTILITEDPILFHALRNPFFKRGGFVPVTVTTQDEALSILEEQDPALAIFHLKSSDLDGAAFCRELKADPLLRKIPVLLICPSDLEEDIRLCVEANCDGVVPAPLGREFFMESVCRLLNIPKVVAPRFLVSFPVFYGKDSPDIHQGEVVNINRGGVFVCGPSLFPVDTELKLRLAFDDGNEPQECCGRVAWVNHPEWVKNPYQPTGMGIELLDSSTEVMDRIDFFLVGLENGEGALGR